MVPLLGLRRLDDNRGVRPRRSHAGLHRGLQARESCGGSPSAVCCRRRRLRRLTLTPAGRGRTRTPRGSRSSQPPSPPAPVVASDVAIVAARGFPRPARGLRARRDPGVHCPDNCRSLDQPRQFRSSCCLLAYHIGFWTWKSTTVGGIICQLRVVRVDGARLGFADALVRGLSSIFSLAVVGLGGCGFSRIPNGKPGTTRSRAPMW